MAGTMKGEPALPVAEKDDVLIVEVRLRSGRFESKIEIPLMSPDEAKREFIDQWFKLMEAGLKCSPEQESKR
jgi:hypothetical protein